MTVTKSRVPAVPVADRLRWTLGEAAAMTGVGENTLRDLEQKRKFPPRVSVAGTTKWLFVASEVRAWADNRDWQAMVEARCGWEANRAS